MAARAEDVDACDLEIRALGVDFQPESKAVLEKIPRSKPFDADGSNEPLRKWAIERIDLMQRFGKELTGKPFDANDQDIFLACLKDDARVTDLLTELGAGAGTDGRLI